MKTIARIFLQGLLVFVPLVGTVALVSWVLVTADELVPLPIPGLGLATILAVIFLLGLVSRNVIGKQIVSAVEAAMARLPVVSLIYGSIKDLLGAFAGDKRSFERPVMVRVGEHARLFGFVTCDHFEDARLTGHVAVYLPQSYNFAGNLVIVPESAVESVDADSAQFMAFIVSGGVATMKAARTVVDSQAGFSEALRRRRRK
jgi:uncharacterized membrane protein